MKRAKKAKHDIYIVWNEWTAEEVYFLGKPTKEQVRELVIQTWKGAAKGWTSLHNLTIDDFIANFVLVEKLPRVYESTDFHKTETYHKKRGEE